MIIRNNGDIDLRKIEESGQTFRWHSDGEGGYNIHAFGRCLHARQDGPDADVELECTQDEYDTIWHDYFDMDTDYAAIRAMIDPADEFLTSAAAFGRGIRILKQDPWETLITFIVSQRKNIPAIKSSVERLCEACSPEKDDSGVAGFPTALQISVASDDVLSSCGLGYRVPYIHKTAEILNENNDISVAKMADMSDEELLATLMSLPGVGIKVASCTALFGYHRTDTFPIDVWIDRALKEHYPGGYDMDLYKPYNGIMQQYIFYAYRTISK